MYDKLSYIRRYYRIIRLILIFDCDVVDNMCTMCTLLLSYFMCFSDHLTKNTWLFRIAYNNPLLCEFQEEVKQSYLHLFFVTDIQYLPINSWLSNSVAVALSSGFLTRHPLTKSINSGLH